MGDRVKSRIHNKNYQKQPIDPLEVENPDSDVGRAFVTLANGRTYWMVQEIPLPLPIRFRSDITGIDYAVSEAGDIYWRYEINAEGNDNPTIIREYMRAMEIEIYGQYRITSGSFQDMIPFGSLGLMYHVY